MNIAVIGLSHKTAPVEIREKLSVPDTQMEAAIQTLCSYPHIQEATILSTCNRLEIYIVTPTADRGVQDAIQFLSEFGKLPIKDLKQHLFMLLHKDAVMHLMRVAGGLDSLVLGEGQILAQVKQTHKIGQQYKGMGSILNRLFRQALTAGKRVRTETSIGTGAVSISSAAVELAHMKVCNFDNHRIAILGAGKMSRLLVQHLISKGATDVTILNRSVKRAEELKQMFTAIDLQLQPMTEMMSTIATSTIVFTSTSATEPLLNAAKLTAVIDPHHSLMIFDISVPRNVHSDVNELANIRAFNVDDLKAVVAQNQERRQQMAQEAEGILDEEVENFNSWWQLLETVPTINCLRDKMEAIRMQELEKALSRLGAEFGERHQEAIEALTKGIVNKILQDPMVQLRAQEDSETRKKAMHTLQVLFNLSSEAIEAQ
ncbi:glutamyl-tRNA reductase [Chamaesiphon sp. GL140_3_metabinner_50]|uniref:glutamyl-tRNA reductase n=1 Tax=Chamaesiphon sp. GL140_3_metabinner_50 TaxID=2970812 RepID=UPI0025DBD66E|nr:glutamyl-tRNA reductase [Chamaesiphon sp. GL140_3_metabinner_50]